MKRSMVLKGAIPRRHNRLFTASLFTHAQRKRERNERETRWDLGRVLGLRPHPIPGQILRFALASSSVAILSARSMIE